MFLSRNLNHTKKTHKHVKPRYQLLRTSWHVQTSLFFENSTLHGMRYTAEAGRPIIEK